MTEKIKVTFLGTSGAFPTAKRNHPSFLISFQGDSILVDCGEGTQKQLRKAKISPCKIDKILITHWHGDHILGLPGLLQSLSLNEYNKKLTIYGPKGIKKKIFFMGKAFPYNVNLEVKEISKKFFENDYFYLEAQEMDHGIFCNAYNFVLKNKIKINPEKLKKYNIPEGKHLSPLKSGKNIKYNGKRYLAKNLTFKEKSKKISFVMDTAINPRIKKFVEEADLLVIESTFSSNEEKLAKEHKHMTLKQSVNEAKKANVKKLALVHISDRYENQFENFLKEAKKNFENTIIPEDLNSVEI
jgi:ribonuclease Z